MKKEAPLDKVEVLEQKSLSEILDEIEQNADTLHDFELVELNTKLVKALRRAVEMLKWAVEGDAALLHHREKELAELLT